MLNSSTYLSFVTIPLLFRFWYFLIWDILCLSCTLCNLYFLLYDRTFRLAINNHIFIVILSISLLYQLTNISCILHNDRYDNSWQTSSIFYLIWVFIDYTFYSLQVGLFAWATIERNILIFHDQWTNTKWKRLFIHYLPVVIIIMYYLIYYSTVYFILSCEKSFEDFLTGGIYIPCAFDRTKLGIWDLIFHQIIPTLIIISFCILLLIRVIKQKTRIRPTIQWRRHRKMTIQLLSMSTIYMIFNIPWIVIILIYQLNLTNKISRDGIIYTKFLSYNVIFLFPFVYCLSLSELRSKMKTKCCLWRQRRQIGVITSTRSPTRIGKAWEHYNPRLVR